MPRNSSGTYSLPAGNPVVTATTISSTWANTTLSDIGTAMTDSLSRSGDGGMLAPLELDSGVAAAPGVSWSAETTSGLYRAGAGDFRYSVSSTDVIRIQLAAVTVTGALTVSGAVTVGSLNGITVTDFARLSQANTFLDTVRVSNNGGGVLELIDANAGSNEKRYQARSISGAFNLLTSDDSGVAGSSFLSVARTGTTVDSLALAATAITVNGVNVTDFARLSQNNVFTNPILQMNAAAPFISLRDTGAASNEKDWFIQSSSGQFRIGTSNDAGAGVANAILMDRTGTTVDSIALTATAITLNGVAATDFARLSQANTFTGLQTISTTAPEIRFNETDAAANNRLWSFAVAGEQLAFALYNDAVSGFTNWLTVDRTANTVDLITLASTSAAINSVQITGAGLYLTDGTDNDPSLSFTSDPDTGMYWVASNTIGFTTGGDLKLSIGSGIDIQTEVPIKAFAGSVGAPAYSFSGDQDTGFFSSTGNQIAIALGGVTAGAIAQGSFTGTLTGYAAGPTGTVFWQKMGNQVQLWVSANITGTSNAATLTMTGLPAAVQPASERVVSAWVTDNGNQVLCRASISTSTITFGVSNVSGTQVLGSGSFTGSGTKGLLASWCITYPLNN